MAQALSGTVTFLFTDLVGSTELRERLGDDAAEALRRVHFRLLRQALAARGGQEVKNLGDGLMVAFAGAVDALACAVAMQQTVHRHNQEQEEAHRLNVRVGVQVGEPIAEEGDYFGTPVVAAQRLCDQAQGGQILASELVRRLVGSRGGLTFRDVGALTLKGFAEPFPACEVVWEPAAEGLAIGRPAIEEAAGPLPLPPLLAVDERTAFIGREQELAHLRQAWERARAGHREVVLLAGEPGIGKTRLAAEFALLAHGEGATVLFGRSDEEALIPYQPFVEALRHYAAAGPPSELRAQLGASAAPLARLVPDLVEYVREPWRFSPSGPEEGSPPAEGERYHLFEAVTSLLAAACRSAPVVLVLDDLHWADRPTLLLLKHLVRSHGPSRLMVLGTYREAELSGTHPLRETLADLRRQRASRRLSLDGLDRGSVARLVNAWVGHEAPEPFIQTIRERTEGNPFFIEEVLRHLAESGRLTTDLTAAQLSIPEGVKEVIGQRLSRLSEECNSVLTVASVIGRKFGLDALERASDLPDERLLDALEEAVEACVAEEVPQAAGHYTFSHALIHETLYDELTTTRRIRLHGQTLRYADSDGVKLAYEVLGSSGPHLVAVALSSCPAVRGRLRTMARRWDRLSRRCRVVLYDRRGVGFSAAPERGYSLLASVEDLRAVLDALGVERAVVWGATDGGPLATAFAAQYPERIAGLILLGTTPKLRTSDEFPWGLSAEAEQALLRLAPVDHGQAASELTRMRQALDDAEAIGEVMRRVPQRVWSKILGALATADVRSLLPQVCAPTLIVHDPGNTYIPAEAARYLHEHVPGSKLEITEEYGPTIFGENLFRTIETFIEEVTARSGP